ncbi:MAG: hypothetical protein C4589_07125 [Peptococcaceae bacterium]|nr:MAG: hypothetical protein C4589_07125 [Peptococcaceae bacterium]
MFFRKVTSRRNGKEYNYLKLIENYREGDKVKQRVVANLGSLDNLTAEKAQNLISGLSRICGLDHPDLPFIEARKVLRYGDVLAVHGIWEMLGVTSAVKQLLPDPGPDLDVSLLLELMVLSRLAGLQNKRSLNDWCRGLYLPGLGDRELLPHHFSRALTLLAGVREKLEEKIFSGACKLIAVDTGAAFCRLTTAYFEPVSRGRPQATTYGKYFIGEYGERKQVDLGILASKDGMPFGHWLFPVMPEQGKFQEVFLLLKERFGIDRCIFVGENKVKANPQLELLMAHRCDYLVGQKLTDRRDKQFFAGELDAGKNDFNQLNDELWFKELKFNDVRYLLCFDPRKDPAQRQQQAFLLATNSDILSGSESIRAYAALAELAESCREVTAFDLQEMSFSYTEPDVSAHIFVYILACMLADVMERMLRFAGINLTCRQALDVMEEIKLAAGRFGGREVRLVTQTQRIHGDIMRALGLKELPRVVV